MAKVNDDSGFKVRASARINRGMFVEAASSKCGTSDDSPTQMHALCFNSNASYEGIGNLTIPQALLAVWTLPSPTFNWKRFQDGDG
jgi:hypothetical protein